MAASRDNPAVAPLYDAFNPGGPRPYLGRSSRLPAGVGWRSSLCGELASDPMHISTLLRLGLRRLWVCGAQPARLKAAIAAWPHER